MTSTRSPSVRVAPPSLPAAASAEVRASRWFTAAFGARPAVFVRSPGRVNLIGEHTDYNDGLALPLALDRALWLALAPRDDERVHLVSETDGVVHEFARGAGAQRWPGWTVYVQGMLWALSRTATGGFDAAVASDVPTGAGLSSSAALELAVARGVAALDDGEWNPIAAARLAQKAENQWVGVNTGMMDQLVCANGRKDHAVLLDCRDLSLRHIRVPEAFRVAVLDTGARRELVGSAYDDRRRECDQAAAALGVASLRDVSVDDLKRIDQLESPLAQRARHVVTENARVLESVRALRDGDGEALGRAMDASHASLRDDFQVSGPQLDVMAALASAADGVLGARMTGGGFAGCAVAVVEAGTEGGLERAVLQPYRDRTGLDPQLYVVRPGDGTSLH